MSEHITHVAVYEDAIRLMQLGKNRFPSAFIKAMQTAYDTGLLCAAMRGGRYFIVPLMLEQRKVEQKSHRDFERLAASIGAIAHRAADHTFKPLFKASASDNNPHFYEQEAQTFHDAVTFEKVYDNGNRPSVSPFQDFSPSTLSDKFDNFSSINKFDIKPFETLVTFSYLNDFAQIRQIDLTNLSADELSNKMINSVQSPYEPIPWYVQANRHPDPVKYLHYIVKPNMYNDDDAIIQMVRALQIHQSYATEMQLDEAIKKATNPAPKQSAYARALGLCWQYLQVISQLYIDEISEDEAYKSLRISDKQVRQIKEAFSA